MMRNITSNKYFLAAMIATAIIILDQASKYYFLFEFEIFKKRVVEVTSFFNIVMVWNKGVSFGSFSNLGEWGPYIINGVALIIVGFLANWLRTEKCKLTIIAIACIIGGAIGNMIDRFLYGAVFDFLDFHYAGFHWYAFNVADSAIFIGVMLIFVQTIILKSDEKIEEK